MADRSFYVVAYDVTDDRRRAKIARYLEAMGERVQGSVFEAYLTAAEVEKLLRKLTRVMNEEEDSVRVYLLCGVCREKVRMVGRGRVTPPPGLMII